MPREVESQNNTYENLSTPTLVVTRTAESFKYHTDSKEYKEAEDLIKEGCIPVLIEAHKSLSEAAASVYLIENLMRISGSQIVGIDVVVADTLVEKKQSKESAEAFGIFNNFIEEKNRDKEDYISLLKVSHINNVEKSFHLLDLFNMIESPFKKRVLVIFAEGRIEGGRPKDPNGDPNDINGMIKARNIDGIIEKQQKRYDKGKGKFFYWPVGISNSWKVLSPVTYQFPKGFLENLRSPYSYKTIGNVKFGRPIKPEDLIGIEDKTSYLMYHVAELLPENERGVYNSKNLRVDLI